MIKTNKRMRGLYAKHLNKLYDYARGDFKDNICYMCTAGKEAGGYNPFNNSACNFCPLDSDLYCGGRMRLLNLKDMGGKPTMSYANAMPISIRKHAEWIEKQIVKNTGCEFYWK